MTGCSTVRIFKINYILGVWGYIIFLTFIKNPVCRRKWQPTLVFLPGESTWTEEPSGLQSMGSQRVGHDWATSFSLKNPMCVLVTQSCLDSVQPHGLYQPGSSVHWILQARILENFSIPKELAFPSPGDLPNPGIKPKSPTWQADSLLSGPPGKLRT